jgi:hypothetical protein
MGVVPTLSSAALPKAEHSFMLEERTKAIMGIVALIIASLITGQGHCSTIGERHNATLSKNLS